MKKYKYRTLFNLSLLFNNKRRVRSYASPIILLTSASIILANFLLYGFLVFWRKEKREKL